MSCALLLVAPLAVAVLPVLLSLTAGHGEDDAAQVDLARLLIILVIPQLLLYALAGAAGAVMNANRRFALPAAAPALENVGIIAVLGLVAWRYGTNHSSMSDQPTSEVLLLGIGSTVAVGLNAGLQWWGAHRVGIAVVPKRGWRDPEVRAVVRRATRSIGQAGLLAMQMLALLLVANRVEGGTVAVQIALNFYYLPIAIVATPVALALLPRLSRLTDREQGNAFADTFKDGFALALFVTIPAAVGYLILADPVAHVVAAGQMASTAGVTMISGSLAALAVGLVGQTAFLVTMQASYARRDTRTPLVAMTLQALVFIALLGASTRADGTRLILWASIAYAAAAVCGGLYLFARVAVRLSPGHVRLWPSVLRTAGAALVMAWPVMVASQAIAHNVGGRLGWTLALLSGGALGVLLFVGTAALLRAPELVWIVDALGKKRAHAEADASRS